MKMTKPNLVRFVCCLLAFAAARVWPVHRICQFEGSKDYTLHRFKVTLFDPYDPMRGRFLRLQVLPNTYRWEKPLFPEGKAMFRAPTAWIRLGRDQEGFAKIEHLSLEPLAGPGCLKVKAHLCWNNKKKMYEVHYPFDRYFINEKLADDAEAALTGATRTKRPAEIRVRIYPDGNFMIEELLLDGKPIREILRPRKETAK